MTTIGENIGDKIRKLREAKGWSQTDLANEVGLTYKYISKIEVGDRYPSRATVAKLSVVLGVDPKELMFADDKNEFVREAENRVRLKFGELLAGRDTVLRELAVVLARRAPPDAVAMALWDLLLAAGYTDAEIAEITGLLRMIE